MFLYDIYIVYVQIENIQKRTLKNFKFENLSTIHKFFFELSLKSYLGQGDPIIGIMG